jgi:hypothetical protein
VVFITRKSRLLRDFLSLLSSNPKRERVPLEKLIVAQPVKEFPTFNGNRSLIIVFTIIRNYAY